MYSRKEHHRALEAPHPAFVAAFLLTVVLVISVVQHLIPTG
jgi:hypothetical protein